MKNMEKGETPKMEAKDHDKKFLKTAAKLAKKTEKISKKSAKKGKK